MKRLPPGVFFVLYLSEKNNHYLRKKIATYLGIEEGNHAGRTVAKNFSALFILQMLNYILPLVLIPFLLKKLGSDGYGVFAFAQYTIQYLVIITDYGFNFSATKQISVNQQDKEKISRIFSAVLFIRLGLCVISLLLLLAFCYAWNDSGEETGIMLLTFLSVTGSALMPLWFFQGIEKMKWITIVNVISKMVMLLLVLLMVESESDVHLAAFLFGITQLAAGIMALGIAIGLFKVRILFPQWKEINNQLKQGWYVFISTFYTSVYVNSNGFLIGILTQNNVLVGYYQVGEKVVRAVTSFFIPFTTAVFPFISKKIAEHRQNGVHLFFRILARVSMLSLLASLFLFIMAPFICQWLFPGSAQPATMVVRILSVIPFFGTAGSMLSYQLFLNIGLQRALPYLLGFLMFLDILACIIFIPHYTYEGAAWALAFTEVLAPILYLLVYRSVRN